MFNDDTNRISVVTMMRRLFPPDLANWHISGVRWFTPRQLRIYFCYAFCDKNRGTFLSSGTIFCTAQIEGIFIVQNTQTDLIYSLLQCNDLLLLNGNVAVGVDHRIVFELTRCQIIDRLQQTIGSRRLVKSGYENDPFFGQLDCRIRDYLLMVEHDIPVCSSADRWVIVACFCAAWWDCEKSKCW